MANQPDSRIKETVIVSGSASLLLLVLSWPAFKYFFFAEAFTYLRIYELNGRDLWQAAFSRMDGMFFRPGLFFADIWWHFVLPPNPAVYHVRNFIFCTINLVLFYRVMLKFVPLRSARIVSLGLFAASKMHMTIIGYINVYEASILLMTILLTVLFWSRYVETRRPFDYSLTLLLYAFCAYSKDNGFILIVILAMMIVVPAIKPGQLKNQVFYWGPRFVPFILISVSYLVVRYVLTGPLNRDNPIYSPRLSFRVTVQQTIAFLATVGNFSLTDPGAMGAKGFVRVFANDSKVIEFALCSGLWILIIFTLWRCRSAWRRLVVPVVWIGLYLSPVFLIRNHQVYYYQEPLVGLALVLGICLDQAPRRLATTWFVVVALIAMNGFISNRRSDYTWQRTANAAEIVKPIVASQKDNPPESIIFVSAPELLNFWRFAIGGPFVPHLLRSRDTAVAVVSSGDPIPPVERVYYLPAGL